MLDYIYSNPYFLATYMFSPEDYIHAYVETDIQVHWTSIGCLWVNLVVNVQHEKLDTKDLHSL